MAETGASAQIVQYSVADELIDTLESTPDQAGFCLIEESALKGVTRGSLSRILSSKKMIVFVKNSPNFFLNTPEANSNLTPLFIHLNELSPVTISLLAQVSSENFAAQEGRKSLEDSQLKQAILVHELRNPLMVIKGKCRSIVKSIPQASKSDPWVQEILEDCDKILKSCEKITSISAASLESPSATKVVDTSKLEPQQLADLVWNSMEEASMTFEVPVKIIDNIEPVEVLCDKASFEGALINLIKNAHDAIKTQKDPWIKIITRLKGNLIVLQVIDSGNGIKDADKIFEPYYTTKKTDGGKGLGLQVVQSFFHSMGGRIKYLKNEDGNTCFEVEFPLNPPS